MKPHGKQTSRLPRTRKLTDRETPRKAESIRPSPSAQPRDLPSPAPPLRLPPFPYPAGTASTFSFRVTPAFGAFPVTRGAEHCGPAGQRERARRETGRRKPKDQCAPAGRSPARAHWEAAGPEGAWRTLRRAQWGGASRPWRGVPEAGGEGAGSGCGRRRKCHGVGPWSFFSLVLYSRTAGEHAEPPLRSGSG